MKLDKAIELLNTAKEGWPVGDSEDYYKALELGIEALKRVKLNRGYELRVHPLLLLGETED